MRLTTPGRGLNRAFVSSRNPSAHRENPESATAGVFTERWLRLREDGPGTRRGRIITDGDEKPAEPHGHHLECIARAFRDSPVMTARAGAIDGEALHRVTAGVIIAIEATLEEQLPSSPRTRANSNHRSRRPRDSLGVVTLRPEWAPVADQFDRVVMCPPVTPSGIRSRSHCPRLSIATMKECPRHCPSHRSRPKQCARGPDIFCGVVGLITSYEVMPVTATFPLLSVATALPAWSRVTRIIPLRPRVKDLSACAVSVLIALIMSGEE